MFCGQCGKLKEVDTLYCMSCGNRFPAFSRFSELSTPATSPSALAFAGAAAGSASVPVSDFSPFNVNQGDTPESEGVKLQGVHGWLKFFCVGHCLLGPLLTFARLGNDDPTPLTVTLLLALMTYQIAVGVSVWRMSRNALRYLRFFFIFQFVLAGLEICGGLLLEQNQQSIHEGGSLLSEAAKSIFAAIVWQAYFRKSPRVRNTFGRNL